MKEFLQKSFQWNPVVELSVYGNEKYKEYMKSYMKCDFPAFVEGDIISGEFRCSNPYSKAISHSGLSISVIGRYSSKDGKVMDIFLKRTKVVLGPSEIAPLSALEAKFNFHNVKFLTTSYAGDYISAEYFVEFRVSHVLMDYVVTRPFVVLAFNKHAMKNVTSEIGIQGVLHIEFVFTKKYHDLMEPVIGKIFFLVAKLRIVKMCITLVRKEVYKSDSFVYEKTCDIKTWEIMDGAICRGDSIPVRLFSREIENIYPMTAAESAPFKVKYFLQATLEDENGKLYFRKLKIRYYRDARVLESLSSEQQNT